MTARPGRRTMEMNGGSSASYLACAPCVSLFCTLFNMGGNRRAFRLPGEGGDHFHCAVEPSPGHSRFGIIQKVFLEKASAVGRMRQKRVKNASKWVFFIGKRGTFQNASEMRSKIASEMLKNVRNTFGENTFWTIPIGVEYCSQWRVIFSQYCEAIDGAGGAGSPMASGHQESRGEHAGIVECQRDTVQHAMACINRDALKSTLFLHGESKGTNCMGQTEPCSQFFTDIRGLFCSFSLFLGNAAFRRCRSSQKPQIFAESHRFSQKAADFCRKLQEAAGFCRNTFVPFSLSL